MKEEKSRFKVVLDIAKKAHEMEEEIRNAELFEKKEEPIKKINEVKPYRNLSLEAHDDYFNEPNDEGKE